MAVGIPVGGWCPKGRAAEDGSVPESYPLVEMKTTSYTSRTEQNVIDSDATLVLNRGKLSGGTKRTVEFCHKHGKPFLVVQMDEVCSVVAVQQWIEDRGIGILNVAGPRESKCPGIYKEAVKFLLEAWGE
jgi:hypothetical protein